MSATKAYLIAGVSNRKSIATALALKLKESGARLLFTAESPEHQGRIEKLFPDSPIYILDVRDSESIQGLGPWVKGQNIRLDGFLHSIAWANYAAGIKPFHETPWSDFSEAMKISCFSLVEMSGALKECFNHDASVVTVSISNTKVASYGYMGPIKSALEGAVAYLAKSFSEFSRVRFNAVCAGPLKTSASAGIPGYIDNYLFAEQLTLRREALKTEEVAETIAFLLGQNSSGINGTGIVVDAGMGINTFDERVVSKAMRS
jgi:enoyl-[acyl-carrier protein] reductase I